VKFRLVIAYDGTAYQGWQTQKIGTGVQAKVEAALAGVIPSAPRLHSSSRTDTGVHALGMVAHFEVSPRECRLPARKLLLALNAHLPEDIRVMAAAVARPGFHARFDARAKEYRYEVWNHPAMNPLLRFHAWHVPRPLDLAAMRAAARHFEGRHDFAAFTANPGYARASTVRTLYRCAIRRSGPRLTFCLVGSGFLYKMCRGIVGTLVQVGLQRFPPEAVRAMLAGRDRRLAGMTAPAHGLTLWKVSYRRPPGATAAVTDLRETGVDEE
jgi:tRNA pseudouridine38-40 synthase